MVIGKQSEGFMRRLRDKIFAPCWRRVVVVGVGALALLALGAGNAAAQPANDNFANATDLGILGTPGTFSDNNTGASREPGEPLIVTNAGGASLWYTWTAPTSGTVSFDTVGSTIDTLLGVYLGNSVSNLTLIAQDDNSGGGTASKVTFNAVAGTVFRIAVDGAGGVQGGIALNWSLVEPTAASPNDIFANATVISGGSGTIVGYNLFATKESKLATNPPPPRIITEPNIGGNAGGASIWYSWTAPSSGVVTFDTAGSSFDTLLGVFNGTNVFQLFSLAQNDDFMEKRSSLVSLFVSAGTTYSIAIDGYNSTVVASNAATGFVALNWNLQPLPSNDSFASAAALDSSSLSGSISANNLGATTEAGEPSHAGFPALQSLWYKWTAPQDGEVQMDTIGSSFDTVLAVYTGNSVSALNQIAANDDMIPAFPQPGIGQTGQFNEAAEPTCNTNIPIPPGTLTIYATNPVPIPNIFFSLQNVLLTQPFSGFPGTSFSGSGASGLRFNAKAGTTYYFAVGDKSGLAGPFNLNWAYHSSGVFRFATELQDKTSGVPAKNSFGGIGATTGYPGMALYQVAESEEFGSRNTEGVDGDAFNSTFHTVYSFGALSEGVLVTVTRVGGSAGRVTVGYSTVDGDQISDHYSFDPIDGGLVPDGVPIPLNGDAPALAFDPTTFSSDYAPVSGTLTFDDFEMSKTILIPVIDDYGRDSGSPGLGLARPNRDFAVVLFNPQTDAQESPVVSKPRLDPIFSQALVRILDADMDPRGPSVGSQVVTNFDPVMMTNIVQTNIVIGLDSTNAIFNFLKSNYRIPEDDYDYWSNTTQITIYVSRSGTNISGASCFYRINSPFLDTQDSGNQANIEFPLEPGSDYATPTPVNAAATLGRDPSDFGGGASGTLTWGDKDFKPKPITFTVNNDQLTEFNEDFRISLYEVWDTHPRPVGMINETTVTILFDDQDPPAGSVDEFYNPDFGPDIITAINGNPVGTEPREHPGTDAQGQVNALVVQPGDSKTIIGGVFSSYNGVQRHGLARINTSGEIDNTFDPGDGVNITGGNFVTALALQLDGKIVVAGSFTSFNGQPCGNVIRLNTNGTIDTAFETIAGTGANGPVRSIIVRDDGKIVLGGDFTSFNGNTRRHMARLNGNGSLDATFDPGTALNDAVYAMAPQISAPIQISANANGGSTEYTNIVNVGAVSGVLRVNYDMLIVPDDLRIYYGGTNTAFLPNGGPPGALIFDTGMVSGTNSLVIPFGPTNGITANTITIVMNQGNGNPGTLWLFNATVQPTAGDAVTVGGDFTSAGGVFGQDHIARVLGNGSLDLTFDPNAGANARVRSIIGQVDGKVVIGGDFTVVNGQTANHITRLNGDGSIDTGFFSGIGTDDGVYHLNYIPPGITVTQVLVGTDVTTGFITNNASIYIGGPFTLYNGTHRLGFGRLNDDGSLDTTFLDSAYNQFAGLPRTYFGDRANAVFASAVQPDGNVMIGGTFSRVGGGQFDANVRTNSFDPNEYLEPKRRDGVRNRNNVARLIGGATAGPGNIGLLQANYPANKSQGFIYALLTRTNGTLGYATANFSVAPGTALAGIDYTYNASAPVYPEMWEYIGPSRMHSDGLWGTNTVMNDNFGKLWSLGLNGMQSAIVSINNNQLTAGDVHSQFQLANPPGSDQFFLGGENIPLGIALGRSIAPLNIADDGKKPGTFGFTAATYAATANTTIGVTRTNGAFNSSPVSVDYATSAGSNTTSGVDYFDTSGTLTFNNGDTLKTFPVQIVQSNYISAIEKTVNLRLFNFPVGASLGITNAVLRLINPNFQGFLNFSATNYVTNLNAGAIQFTVARTVGGKGTLDVQYSTTNGSALAGTDYRAASGTLHWNDGDVTPRIVTVPLINNGGLGGNKTFFANLSNPLLNGSSAPSLLGTITNTSLTISNDNNFGVFEFSAPSYVVNEATNGFATITVIRAGTTLGTATLNIATSNGTAVAGVNYVATNGTVSFAQGQTAASFPVKILNDGVTNTIPFYFNIVLSNPSTGAVLGSPTNAQINILDTQSFNRPPGDGDVTFTSSGISGDVLALALQTNGPIVAVGNFTSVNGIPKNHVARFNGDGSLDQDFLSGLSGADGSVNAVVIQSDGRILLGGAFGNVDGVVRNRVARMSTDGSLDTSFSPGSGADNAVFSFAETFAGATRQIYVGGAFTTFNGSATPGLVRLNDNGTLDSSFTSTGANGIVYAIAVYPTNSIFAGKVLIGGSFITVDGIAETNIARLNADGTLDTNFVVNVDGIVRALAIQNDEAVVIGGDFTHVNGTAAARVARLNTDGTADTTFASALAPGFDDTVNAIVMQSDNRIVVAGQFLNANGLTRHHITRLLPSGAADPTINFGDGADGGINAVAVQAVDQMIVIGGAFTHYNDQPAPHLTRIYGGSITGSGAFEFTSADYTVNENGLQAAITVRRTGGTSGPNSDGTGNVTVQFVTTPGTAVPGVNYTTVSTSISFPPGEVLETAFVPIIDDLVITSNKTVDLALLNPSDPAGLGDQTNAVLTIINTDNAISFASDTFQVAKSTPTGFAIVNIVRSGGSTAAATVGFATTTNGTAVIGTDYTPASATVIFNPGDSNKTVQVPIINNGLPEGDRTVTMMISNILGATIASPSNAVLTIRDTTFAPGQLSLSTTNYFVNEGDGVATITVNRTGGSSGAVSAFYYTTPITATPGLNYISVSNSVSFADGQTNRTFSIPLIDNNVVQGQVTLTVTLLTNLSSGTTIGIPSNAVVFIADNDIGFSFVNATNIFPETIGAASVQVQRIGPTNSTLSVNYATHDGTALAGTNYTATSGTLTFTPGQIIKSIVVPLIDDQEVTGDLLFTVVLSTNSASLGAVLAYPSTNTVIIHDADAGLSFTNASMIVRRDAGTALVTVVCSNPGVEPVITDSNTVPLSVQYTTVDGSALANVDYIARSGTLIFTNGNGTNTFFVPIINNGSVSGDRSFNVRLFNPTTPGRLVAPSNQTITIIDATAGFKFSQPKYTVNKTDGSALINVFRTGLTDSVATVDFAATNGSAIDGVHYVSTNGTLIFTNGVTNQTFSVQVIDTSVVQPNKTVLLQLFNASNSVITSPNAATLTIVDNTGSFVVPSGSAIVSESGAGAPNGVIDSNETVTVLFGFRDAGGLNVANLMATLIATNGVTPTPNPETQTYGPLISSSHSASQPFTFMAHGTNGQEIVATFLLQDGSTNIGTGVFGYQLGSTMTRFTNAATITINDDAVASPYPSAINVTNLVGAVLKATITLTNVIHASPGDIDALLVSPAQQTTLFMAHDGAQNAISNVTITFDDGASAPLPQSGQIISGTNKPSAYLPVPIFP
jgi:uncharacterized delta-60 repeat protein